MQLLFQAVTYLLCIVVLSAGELQARQASPPGQATPTGRAILRATASYTAAPTTEHITLDGRLNEPAWQTAEPIRNFEQRDPDEGKPATEQTTLRFLYDSRALYVGVELLDSHPDQIVSRTSKRDDPQDGDYFQLYLDPYHDHVTGVMFQVSAAGSLQDSIISNDVQIDSSWDAVWDAAVSKDNKGWYIEMRIPFSQLRFAHLDKQTWGMNASRFLFRRNETSWLERVPKIEQGLASRFADLTGVDNVEQGHSLELLPYIRGSAGFAPAVAGNPFATGSDFGAGAGMDLKYALGPNLTLSGTINPDFGQVEVDPAVINLTAVETFLQEKRPFFVEGSQIFSNFGRMGGSCCGVEFPTYFYSRRIGRTPQGTADGDFVSTPSAVSILGAAKITGKPSKAWTLGLLTAATDSEYADVQTAGVRSQVPVEPFANYFVARILREFGNRAGVGMLVSGVDRRQNVPALADIMPGHAHVAGADGYFYFDKKHSWSINGRFAESLSQGTPDAINVLQTSSQRYLQRPDAPNLHYNPLATSMRGWESGANFSKNNGGWTMWASLSGASPRFDTNELGYQTNADVWGTAESFNWRQIKPDRFSRNRNVNIFRFDSWNYNRDRKNTFTDLSTNITLRNYWSIYLDGSYNQKVLDDRLTRGGPLAAVGGDRNYNVALSSDGRKRINMSLNNGYSDNPYGSWSTYWNLNVGLKPAASILITAGPSFNRSYIFDQYVTTVADPAAINTYGSRYVFAGIDQSQPAMTTRANWSVTPKTSLQVFSQILLGDGRYWNFKEFAKPRTLSFLTYGKDIGTISESNGQYTVDPDGSGPASSFAFADPNFNFKSLLINAVYRWEWRPGTALYVVWQQSRQDSEFPGSIAAGRDLRALFGTPSTNLFLVKTTYWFNR